MERKRLNRSGCLRRKWLLLAVGAGHNTDKVLSDFTRMVPEAVEQGLWNIGKKLLSKDKVV